MYNALQFDSLIIRPFRRILFLGQASVLGTRLFTNELLVRTVIKHIRLISYTFYTYRHADCSRLSNVRCTRELPGLRKDHIGGGGAILRIDNFFFTRISCGKYKYQPATTTGVRFRYDIKHLQELAMTAIDRFQNIISFTQHPSIY